MTREIVQDRAPTTSTYARAKAPRRPGTVYAYLLTERLRVEQTVPGLLGALARPYVDVVVRALARFRGYRNLLVDLIQYPAGKARRPSNSATGT